MGLKKEQEQLQQQFKNNYYWHNFQADPVNKVTNYKLDQLVNDSYDFYLHQERKNGSLDKMLAKLNNNIAKGKVDV